jgi:hypothetical protein
MKSNIVLETNQIIQIKSSLKHEVKLVDVMQQFLPIL